MARARSTFEFRVLHDGVIKWFDGPEWDDVVEEAFKQAETEMEESARRNAPWVDRTGDARRGITADTFHYDNVVGINLFHTVEYGKWLELIQNGRYAIIMPTLETEGRRITYNAIRRVRYARRGDS